MKSRKPTPALMSAYFAEIGRRGGKKSRRVLTPEKSAEMNEAKRQKRLKELAKPKPRPRPREL